MTHADDPSPPPSDAPSTLLCFHALRRGYGRLRVLRAVSATVAGGEQLLVTGANGSGKSTLLRVLAGLLAPQAGTIECRIDGRALDVAARRRAVGYLAPDLAFYPELSCAENLDFIGRLRGLAPDAGRTLLVRLGLPPGRRAGALSSGMNQRLRWAFALLHRPAVLLLDEPLQNLDAGGRDDVLALLGEHLERGGLAVVANPDALPQLSVDRHLHLEGSGLKPGGTS
ncbi:MAG: ABC transporter ATP-binding protein [Acidobacteriota bacterium]